MWTSSSRECSLELSSSLCDDDLWWLEEECLWKNLNWNPIVIRCDEGDNRSDVEYRLV